MRSYTRALATSVMCRFHAVRIQSISASPKPSSGTPPPPAKQQVSTERVSSEESFMTSTATTVVRSSMGARWASSFIMWISGKPNWRDQTAGETSSSASRSSDASGEGILESIALRREVKA